VKLAEADHDAERDRVNHPAHGPLHSTLNHPEPLMTRLSVCFCVLLFLRCEAADRRSNPRALRCSGRIG
jgi:hypothetical protein